MIVALGYGFAKKNQYGFLDLFPNLDNVLATCISEVKGQIQHVFHVLQKLVNSGHLIGMVLEKDVKLLHQSLASKKV